MFTFSDTWFVSDLMMDILFTMDVFLRFFTAVPMPGHENDGLYVFTTRLSAFGTFILSQFDHPTSHSNVL